MLADGPSIRDLAEYLGHHDPSVTLRIYGHMMPGSHERAWAISTAVSTGLAPCPARLAPRCAWSPLTTSRLPADHPVSPPGSPAAVPAARLQSMITEN
jgi:hypothetical protein